MKILNFGSLNIDMVFKVNKICCPGETICSTSVRRYPGGKGLNQSIALARAGAETYHAGMIGSDGLWLKELLEGTGTDCRYINTVDEPTGSAFIQVEKSGQNCIVLNGGANMCNSRDYCDKILCGFNAGDYLLLQNEINCIDYLITAAHEKGMKIFLNPSPMNSSVTECSLTAVSCFIMNENEGEAITGKQKPADILNEVCSRYGADAVLTLGKQGAMALFDGKMYRQEAFTVKTVDTTGAGDTFTGFFIAALSGGESVATALRLASKAASVSVSREGAGCSIPKMSEVWNS